MGIHKYTINTWYGLQKKKIKNILKSSGFKWVLLFDLRHLGDFLNCIQYCLTRYKIETNEDPWNIELYIFTR